MPQMHLPLFPDGVEHITADLAFEKKDGQVTYFNGHMPVFIHAEEDTATFRMITAQFCINGNAKQADISRAFGITLISVKRAVKRYRQRGPAGFYEGYVCVKCWSLVAASIGAQRRSMRNNRLV